MHIDLPHPIEVHKDMSRVDLIYIVLLVFTNKKKIKKKKKEEKLHVNVSIVLIMRGSNQCQFSNDGNVPVVFTTQLLPFSIYGSQCFICLLPCALKLLLQRRLLSRCAFSYFIHITKAGFKIIFFLKIANSKTRMNSCWSFFSSFSCTLEFLFLLNEKYM